MAKTDAPKVKLRTVDKRMAGRRARETRERILSSLGKLLGSMAYRDVRVTDVVREVNTSPATFYQYFADVETAVLALAQDVTKDAAGLKSLAEGASMSGKAGVATVERIVDGISAFYKENEAVLRVLDSAAAEGSTPFKKARAAWIAAASAPILAVAGTTKEAKTNAAVATALILATAGSRSADSGVTAPELRAAVNKQVLWALTGRKA